MIEAIYENQGIKKAPVENGGRTIVTMKILTERMNRYKVKKKKLITVIKYFFMNWIEDNQDFLRKNPKIRNQWRAWFIMDKYFGIQNPRSGSVSFKVKLPDFIQEEINKMIKRSNEIWEEDAKKN